MSKETFSRLVQTDRIPTTGKHFRFEADETDRRRISESLGITELAKLTGEFDVRPLGAGAFAVRGTVSASVVQTDVVTLEPVCQELLEQVEVMLMPAEGLVDRKAPAVGPEEVEERDLYRNGRIDLGVIAVEHLSLALDPYPRAPGVEFSGHIEDDSTPAESPFSVLAGLKREPN